MDFDICEKLEKGRPPFAVGLPGGPQLIVAPAYQTITDGPTNGEPFSAALAISGSGEERPTTIARGEGKETQRFF
jgi:hypothetical protein